MKNKEKKMILILIIMALIIIAIIWSITRGKNNKDNELQNTNEEEFIRVESDGTIVNTSEKLKEEKIN